MHFTETYGGGLLRRAAIWRSITRLLDPFAGKLMMILMLYMREDAAVVRQPIYGLFLGNILTIIMVQIIRFHPTVAIVPGQSVDTGFLDEMGVLMVWGTSLLYIDAIAIILFYESWDAICSAILSCALQSVAW